MENQDDIKTKRLEADAKVDLILSEFPSSDQRSWCSAKRSADHVEIVFRNLELFGREISVDDDRIRRNASRPQGGRKSAEDSERMRKTGNELFAKARFTESTEKYTEAIRCAPVDRSHFEIACHEEEEEDIDSPKKINGNELESREQQLINARAMLTGSGELSLAFANRSASLFHSKRFQEAIVDVDCALFFAYPLETRYKLYERRAKSWLQLGRKDKVYADASEALRLVQLSAAAADETQRKKLTDSLEILKQKCQITRKERISSKTNSKSGDSNCGEQDNFQGSSEDGLDVSTTNSNNNNKESNGYRCCVARSPCNTFAESLQDVCPETVCLSRDSNICSFFDAVEVRRSELCGRYTVAKHDLHAGEVVATETPYSAVLYPSCYDTHCYRCFARITLPFPCLSCRDVVFCGMKCWRSAWKGFHWAECGWMDRLTYSWVGRIGHLAYRVLLEAGIEGVKKVFGRKLDNFNHKTDQLEMSEDRESDRNGVIQCHPVVSPFSQSDPSTVEDKVASAYEGIVSTLVRHEGERSPTDNMALCVIAFVLLQISKVSGWLPDVVGKDDSNDCVEVERLVYSALFQHLQMIQCNGFEITEMRPISESSADKCQNMLQDHKINCIGVGLYPTLATMNHSCDPTVDLVFYGDKSVTRVIRSVSRSEEVTIDYGHLFFIHRKSQRQRFLRKSYFFDCCCRACADDWPLWQDLPTTELTLKCSKCSAPFKAVVTKKCLRCENDLSRESMDALKKLDDIQKRYAAALQNLAPGLEQRTVDVAEEYLGTMQELVCLPWKEFYSCQATLRQLYRISANLSSSVKLKGTR